jgi:polysaccharide export outer membrane protein
MRRCKSSIYSFDLTDSAVFCLDQQFRINGPDMSYITNSPVAELQRFISIISRKLLPISSVKTVVD